MTEIKLIKEDFDSLEPNTQLFVSQYTNPWDCPITRALKREFPNEEKVAVTCNEVIIGETIICNKYNIGFDEVSIVALEIAEGKEFGIIDFGVDIKPE